MASKSWEEAEVLTTEFEFLAYEFTAILQKTRIKNKWAGQSKLLAFFMTDHKHEEQHKSPINYRDERKKNKNKIKKNNVYFASKIYTLNLTVNL